MTDRPHTPKNAAFQLTPAACLRENREPILQAWEKRVRKEVSASQGKESATLRDSMGLFIDQLIESLEAQTPRLATAKDIARVHAVQRLEFTDFDLEQVMTEYNVLRQIIFQALDEAGIIPSPHERNIILDFIQNGKMAAANRYTQLAIDRTRRSEKRFRALYDLSSTGISVTDPSSKRFVQVNRKFAQMLGYTEEELHGKTFSDVTVPEDAAEQLQIHRQAISGKLSEWKLEKRYVRKDGTVFWAEIWGTLLRDEAGQPELIMASVIDISDRKQVIHRLHDLMTITETALSRTTTLDEVLNRSLEYIRNTFEADTVAVLLANETREYIEIRAARGLEEEIVQKVRIPIGKGIAGRIMMEERALIVDDLTSIEVASPILKQRSLRTLMGVPLRTKQEVIGVIHVGRLDPRPFQEEDLEFLQMIADRLATSIDNASLFLRLQSKLEELRTERELRERFVATVAHDLRSPLTAARLSTQLVFRYPDRADARERQLGKIVHSLERADLMIQNLLDANRIRAGQSLPLEIDECDLRSIAQEVTEEQSMIYGNRFVVQGPLTLPGYWSCNGVRRILENLISNGAKYGQPDTPVTTRLEPKGDRVWITVHNQGSPIPESEQKILFEPFHRAKSAEEKGKPGWGLGLTLVRGLVEAHGGFVSIRSSAEEGTTFKVDFPLDSRPFHVTRA